LRESDKSNFSTLLKAAANNALALVSTVRKSDGAQVALVCAMTKLDDGCIVPSPLAVMVEGNPYELFEDPTQ
jgi:hypothetical protein